MSVEHLATSRHDVKYQNIYPLRKPQMSQNSVVRNLSKCILWHFLHFFGRQYAEQKTKKKKERKRKEKKVESTDIVNICVVLSLCPPSVLVSLRWLSCILPFCLYCTTHTTQTSMPPAGLFFVLSRYFFILIVLAVCILFLLHSRHTVVRSGAVDFSVT